MYRCPCCNNAMESLPAEPKDGGGRICPICCWAEDPCLSSNREPSGRNHGLTLDKARGYYGKCGISDPGLVLYWAEHGVRPWSELFVRMCERAEAFEIHCWSDENEEIALALQYGALHKSNWEGGRVIAGKITREFKVAVASLPKPAGAGPYDKRTPFFSIFFDNGFSSEHYGTEINCSLLWDENLPAHPPDCRQVAGAADATTFHRER